MSCVLDGIAAAAVTVGRKNKEDTTDQLMSISTEHQQLQQAAVKSD